MMKLEIDQQPKKPIASRLLLACFERLVSPTRIAAIVGDLVTTVAVATMAISVVDFNVFI